MIELVKGDSVYILSHMHNYKACLNKLLLGYNDRKGRLEND